MMSGQETIASRFIRLNQIILGRSSSNLPNKQLAHRDSLLDALFAFYEECNVDYMRKDKHIAAFVDKFKGLMIELKSLRVNLKDFEVKKIIGRGHFGEVQVVREKGTGDVYAMKILRKQETLSHQNVAFYKEERDIMSQTRSPWLTKLQYAFQDINNLYLVMEFHPGGDMLSLLEKYDNVLPESMSKFYVAELILAIHSLHTMGYVHRDIKPDNILIDRTGHIKLADFGSSSKLNYNKQVTSSMPIGTPDYVAPEVLTAMNPGPASSKSYGVECDWWSLGIVTYEMIFGSTPFANEKVLLVYNNIMNFKHSLKFPEALDISESMISLIKGLLQDSSQRLGYEELLVHPLFNDIDWNNIQHTAPPFVPNVTSVDDTSNFDDFEPENRPYFGDLKCKREFSGKNLPFIGFTYTTPFEMKVERLSSVDTIMSPSTSFCESESSSHKKELLTLQNKLTEVLSTEETQRTEIQRLKSSCENKDKEVNKCKNEMRILEGIITEMTTEIKQMKQLLLYEREHRVIAEQKGAQLVRCMKSKQKQDALRLRAKSIELNKGEKDVNVLEQELDEALTSIGNFIKEKAELTEELAAAKHMLLDYEVKLKKLGQQVDYPDNKDESVSHSSKQNLSSEYLSSYSPYSKPDLKKLVFKLEKKNKELENDLEHITAAKTEVTNQNLALQNKVLELQDKIEELERNISNKTLQDSNLQDSEESVNKGNSIILSQSEMSDNVIEKETKQKEFQNVSIQYENLNEDNVDSLLDGENRSMSGRSSTEEPIKKLDVSCQTLKIAETCVSDTRILKDISNMQKRMSSLEDTPELKKEYKILKNEVESLTSEINRLNEELKNKDNSFADIQKQLREKEEALSTAKLDLRLSTRKEQQAENMCSNLRERNKDLRQELKSLEQKMTEKLNLENNLKEQIKKLEAELAVKSKEVLEKQRIFEIEQAKHEEREKNMQYTCEICKVVSQKFEKNQDRYEELLKQNVDLSKERDEKHLTNTTLLKEIKELTEKLEVKEKECAKYEKVNKTLKSCILDMEEQMKEFENLIEDRDSVIQDLKERENFLTSNIQKLEENLRRLTESKRQTDKKNEELKKHVEDLTAEIEDNNNLLESDLQSTQEQLMHHKKIIQENEEHCAALQKEIANLNNDNKTLSEKIVALESQLCEIKEEAARHITQISSLKTSNLKLTQALEESIDQNKEAKQYAEVLCDELESAKANHILERTKMQETISQQSKLIDFLQSKTESMEKRKKPHLSRIFGKKETCCAPSNQNRDVTELLEREKIRCRRLQDQLSQARAENVALQREMSDYKNACVNVEVPVSPSSRAMHCAITYSPTTNPDVNSPGIISTELVKKIAKPPGMKHKIPHRFTNVICMRSTKCCACLDSLHFGRLIAKCQECSIMCHITCATSLPSTCGLPSGFMQHFKHAISDCSSASCSEKSGHISEGWIKIPKNNKLGWDRRYMRLMKNVLYLFENSDDKDPSKAVMKLDFNPEEGKVLVTTAVSPTELTHAATSDLPYVLKLEYFPHTTCWPNRSLYIMTSNFSEKQMWASTLEALAEENQLEVDCPRKNKLAKKVVWTMTGERLESPLCAYVLNNNIVLMGTADGLYILDIIDKYTFSFKSKIEDLPYVYQIACIESINLVIMIQGYERKLTMTQLSTINSSLQTSINESLVSKPLPDISECHLFSVGDIHKNGTPYLCIATSKTVMLYQWDDILKAFCPKKAIITKEPCSCMHFTPNSMIFGSDCFYELDLTVYCVKKFLDDHDASLAGVIYGASQFRSFPIAIFQVSSPGESVEYLMCFHEMGVFVNGNGQRTREDDMKWSRLPLSFAYQLPYLFVLHFNSLEVIEIPPQSVQEVGLRAVTLVPKPQYLGPAHVQQSVLLSSSHNQAIELILVEGNSIGQSDFQRQSTSSTEGSCSASSCTESPNKSDGLEFSFSTSIEQSLVASEDQLSIDSRTSVDSDSQS